MNVYTPAPANNPVVKSLRESFNRCRTIKEFLRENGDTLNTRHEFCKMALTESAENPDAKFTFENGMFLPSISNKFSSKYSLRGIFESSENCESFINGVKQLCESKLEFTLTDKDIENLREHYTKQIIERL